MTVDSSENVGIALAMVFGAGASTGLGAAVVFFPSIVKLASQRVLAASLGFSAGVMTYVSFVEIFAKSSTGFEDAGYAENHAYIYATSCFFAGVVLMIVRAMFWSYDCCAICRTFAFLINSSSLVATKCICLQIVGRKTSSSSRWAYSTCC